MNYAQSVMLYLHFDHCCYINWKQTKIIFLIPFLSLKQEISVGSDWQHELEINSNCTVSLNWRLQTIKIKKRRAACLLRMFYQPGNKLFYMLCWFFFDISIIQKLQWKLYRLHSFCFIGTWLLVDINFIKDSFH